MSTRGIATEWDGRMFLASLKLFRPRAGKTPQSGHALLLWRHRQTLLPSEPRQYLPLKAQNASLRSEALRLASPKAFPTLTSEQALFPHAFKSKAPSPCKRQGPLPSNSCGQGWPLPSASGFRRRVIGARGSFARYRALSLQRKGGLP
jgi:hypothetical protein